MPRKPASSRLNRPGRRYPVSRQEYQDRKKNKEKRKEDARNNNPNTPKMIASKMLDWKPPTRQSPKFFRPGTVALREIRYYQKTTNLLIPKKSFDDLAKEISQESGSSFRFGKDVLTALQTSAEDFLTNILRLANLVAIRQKRVTITPEDIKVVMELLDIQQI
ncbi:hypothetical protein CAEBREN_25677 [Caenorhabditis brenneri]|uniref:Core Histone H2A/H2B/H3 domain-containing protein n=1 Tax=Caenorhabditis brenneri TaxID=135651 RepID=G0NE38_CAEBE|nr:hypothetical protein CAEBREN_25677 [Caenorhabditis brenneri]